MLCNNFNRNGSPPLAKSNVCSLLACFSALRPISPYGSHHQSADSIALDCKIRANSKNINIRRRVMARRLMFILI